MKASKLIAILAEHLAEHGECEVLVSSPEGYHEVTNCWHNYGKEWGAKDRIIISPAANIKGEDE